MFKSIIFIVIPYVCLAVNICEKNVNFESLDANIITKNTIPVKTQNYLRYDNMSNWLDCVQLCCSNDKCNLAFYESNQFCYLITCADSDSCIPRKNLLKIETDYDDYLVMVRSFEETSAKVAVAQAVSTCDPAMNQCDANEKCTLDERTQVYECKCKAFKYKRVNGVCREYLVNPAIKSCQLYIAGECDDTLNEECITVHDRVRHGTCQCKYGYERNLENGLCELVVDLNHGISDTKLVPGNVDVDVANSQVFGDHRKKAKTTNTTAINVNTLAIFPKATDNDTKDTTPNNQPSTTKATSTSSSSTESSKTTSTTTTSTTTTTTSSTEPPSTDVIADAGPDQQLYYPTRTCFLNSNLSRTLDNRMIVRWEWSKSEQSPALGHFVEINGKSTANEPIAYVENLVEGEYVFNLKIWTDKRNYGSDSVKVTVHQTDVASYIADNNINSITKSQFDNRVELDINISPFKFSELEKQNLINKLELILQQPPIIIHPKIHVTNVDLSFKNEKSGVLIDFYVTDNPPSRRDRRSVEIGETQNVVDSEVVIRLLRKAIIENSSKHFLQVNIRDIKATRCFKNCSNHGYCDELTFKCVCDPYWMPNLYKFYVMRDLDQTYGNNCEWSTLYVLLAAILMLFGVFMIVYACFTCCCCRRRRYVDEKPHQKQKRSCLSRLCCCCCGSRDDGGEKKIKLGRSKSNETKYALLESMDDNFQIKGKKAKQMRTYGVNSSDDEDVDENSKNMLNKEEDEDVIYEQEKFNNKTTKKSNQNIA